MLFYGLYFILKKEHQTFTLISFNLWYSSQQQNKIHSVFIQKSAVHSVWNKLKYTQLLDTKNIPVFVSKIFI